MQPSTAKGMFQLVAWPINMSFGEQDGDGQNDQLCVPAQILQEEKPLGRKIENPDCVLPEL